MERSCGLSIGQRLCLDRRSNCLYLTGQLTSSAASYIHLEKETVWSSSHDVNDASSEELSGCLRIA